MKQVSKGVITCLIVMVMVMNLLVGCDNKSLSSYNEETVFYQMEQESDYENFITIDVFSTQANYQGIQAGWFGEVVKAKFNMELNIIAPNIAGGGDTLFQTRSAAGNLGDLVMIGSENGRLEETIEAGLIMDMSVYEDIMPHAMAYPNAIERIQHYVNRLDEIYALPASVSSYSATEPSESTEPTFGPYLRWDIYTDIGAPEMATLEDLLPVLKEMQAAYPITETGEKTYGFSLFKDWDDNMMMMGKQPACFYGYDEVGFLLNHANGSNMVSIIESDSPYIRSLKLYFEANQLGLVDPESATQNWDSVWEKYMAGEILFSPWPWLGQDAYNTIERMETGSGFMLAPINDMEIFSYGATPNGSNFVVGIGTQAQDPQRMAAFIDWLYSPEGIMMSTTQTGRNCGPEGLTWEMVDGEPTLTEFGIHAFFEGDVEMPIEWGGGSWNDGTSQLSFITVLQKDINPDTNVSYDFRFWDSYLNYTATKLHNLWQKEMNALSTFDYLEANNQYVVAPGTDFTIPGESSEISTLRAQCKSIIVANSWKMVFADNEEQFNQLLKEMQDTVYELGYDKVLAFDIETAKALNMARIEVME